VKIGQRATPLQGPAEPISVFTPATVGSYWVKLAAIRPLVAVPGDIV
jgi:hypothetical protein